MPSPSIDSPIIGSATPNEQYMGLRLVYDDPEDFDPTTTPLVWASLSLHWAKLFFLLAPATLVLIILGLRSPQFYGLVWLLVIVAWSFVPVWVARNEWRFLVDGKAAVAGEAFDHIAWVFGQRETPLSRLKVRRVKLGQGVSRDYLTCRIGVFQGFISCFPFGRDLYLGWTLFCRLSTVKFWLLVLQSAFYSITFRQTSVHWLLRYDRAKALREVIHNAAREGVDAASGEIEFRGAGTIGTDVPIEDVDASEGWQQAITDRVADAGGSIRHHPRHSAEP